MRNEDVWELCQLCEIVVWQLGQLYDPNLLNLPLLFNILTITTNETVSFKLINLLLCVVAVDGQQIQYQRQQIIAIL